MKSKSPNPNLESSPLQGEEDVNVHAETNAILNVGGKIPSGTTLFCTLPPCCACASLIIQSGIANVVFPDGSVTNEMEERWGADWNILGSMFGESGVRIHAHKNPENSAAHSTSPTSSTP